MLCGFVHLVNSRVPVVSYNHSAKHNHKSMNILWKM